MKVWFMRHAYAGPACPVARDERVRPLVNPGPEQAAAVAKEMLLRDEIPKVILCSTLVRSIQTATIVGDLLGVAHVYPITSLTPHVPLHNFIQDLLDENAMRRVMICGHSDRISAFFRRILDIDTEIDFAEVIKVDIDRADIKQAAVMWRLNPTSLGCPDMREQEQRDDERSSGEQLDES